MGMVLPMNYVEVEQEEMMYLDGGFSARDFLYGAIATAVTAFVGKSIKRSIIGAVVRQAGWVLTAQINAAVISVAANPALATGLAASALAGVYLVGKGAGYW